MSEAGKEFAVDVVCAVFVLFENVYVGGDRTRVDLGEDAFDEGEW